MGTRVCSLIRILLHDFFRICRWQHSGNGNMLQDIVASVEDTEFEIEDALDKQLGSRPMPFVGMDSKCSSKNYMAS